MTGFPEAVRRKDLSCSFFNTSKGALEEEDALYSPSELEVSINSVRIN
jgi:hypothetical protein